MSEHSIIIEEGALLDLLLPALECAVTPVRDGASKCGIEVAGVLWGSKNSEQQIYSIRKASVIRLGYNDEESVHFSDESIDLMKRVADTYWPHLIYLGTFHSHPYLNISEDKVIKDALYKQSSQDKMSFKDSEEDLLSIIVSISKYKKNGLAGDYVNAGTNKPDYTALVIRFGGVSAIIKANSKTEKGNSSEKLRLLCPAIIGASMPIGDVFSAFIESV